MNFSTPLTFEMLRRVSVGRCNEVFRPFLSWSPNDYAVATAGELGEACNLLKKDRRGDPGDRSAKLADELADTMIYLDLLAARCGVDLEAAIRKKFDEVSREKGSSFFLGKREDGALCGFGGGWGLLNRSCFREPNHPHHHAYWDRDEALRFRLQPGETTPELPEWANRPFPTKEEG